MTAEQRGEHPSPREPERRFDAQACFHHSLTNTPPRIFSLSPETDFDSTFIPGITKDGNLLRIPGIDAAITRNVLPVITKNFPYNSNYKPFMDGQAKMHVTTLEAAAVGSYIVEVETDEQSDFTVLHPTRDSYFLVVSHPEHQGRQVAINLSGMHETDPELVEQTLVTLYRDRGMADVIMRSQSMVNLHKYGQERDSFISTLTSDPEKSAEEIVMIKNFIETVGGVNENIHQQVRQKVDAYTPNTSAQEERSHYTIEEQLEHMQACQAGTSENILFTQRAIEIGQKLHTTNVELLTDPLLRNPLAYTEKEIQQREVAIEQYKNIADFLKETKTLKTFHEIMNLLERQIPQVHEHFMQFQANERVAIMQIGATGALSELPRHSIAKHILVPNNEPLEDITRILVIKLLQDRISQAHKDEEGRQRNSGLLKDNQRLDPNWMYTEERTGTLESIATNITDKIKNDSQNVDEQRTKLAEMRNEMNVFLEVEEIDRAIVNQIEELIDSEKPRQDQENTFAVAFHLYRLQKQGKIDIESTALRAAIREFLPDEGPDAVAIVDDLVLAA